MPTGMSGVAQEPDTTQSRILHALIRQQGLDEGHYALFFVTGEGKVLPGGSPEDPLEEASGYLLDKQGRVYYFWLGWDPETDQVSFTKWREVAPQPHWTSSAEYRRALERLGLGERRR